MVPIAKTPPVSIFFLDKLKEMMATQSRTILGLVGCPGSGKSTFAESIRQSVPGSQVVPMDGFHLSNSELRRLGLNSKKGAPETFDSAGYVNLLNRLRANSEELIYVPEFRRDLDESLAGAISVPSTTQLVITEGNYLLHEESHWAKVQPLLDEVWYVDLDPAVRRERLVARHQSFGLNQQAALDWVKNTDEPNARLIEATKVRADRVFFLS